jgi:hypothetical protein
MFQTITRPEKKDSGLGNNDHYEVPFLPGCWGGEIVWDETLLSLELLP